MWKFACPSLSNVVCTSWQPFYRMFFDALCHTVQIVLKPSHGMIFNMCLTSMLKINNNLLKTAVKLYPITIEFSIITEFSLCLNNVDMNSNYNKHIIRALKVYLKKWEQIQKLNKNIPIILYIKQSSKTIYIVCI